MKLIPSGGAERVRLIVLLALLGVAAAMAWNMTRDESGNGAIDPTAARQMASNPPGTAEATVPVGKPGARQSPVPSSPQPLNLAGLEQVPDEPAAGRNPFRFGERPPPTPPRPTFTPTPTPTPPPGPPPIPPVPLRLTGVMILAPQQKNRAYLTDASGALFEAVEGQVIDGRYRLVAVGENTAIVSYLDGSGRRTLRVGG